MLALLEFNQELKALGAHSIQVDLGIANAVTARAEGAKKLLSQ